MGHGCGQIGSVIQNGRVNVGGVRLGGLPVPARQPDAPRVGGQRGPGRQRPHYAELQEADVAKLGPFVVADLIQQSAPGGAYSSGDRYSAQYVVDDTAYDEVEVQETPEGELALYGGMHVEASDGRIGKLDELVS